MEPVEDTRDRGEEVGLDDLGVFEQAKVVTGAVGDDPARGDGEEFERALQAGRGISCTCQSGRKKDVAGY